MKPFKVAYKVVRNNSNEIYKGFGFHHLSDATQYYVHPDNQSFKGTIIINPYAVKQTKEVEDNSQLKDDTKDPKLIANLVKDGNFGMPYLPEKLYVELRSFCSACRSGLV